MALVLTYNSAGSLVFTEILAARLKKTDLRVIMKRLDITLSLGW